MYHMTWLILFFLRWPLFIEVHKTGPEPNRNVLIGPIMIGFGPAPKIVSINICTTYKVKRQLYMANWQSSKILIKNNNRQQNFHN